MKTITIEVDDLTPMQIERLIKVISDTLYKDWSENSYTLFDQNREALFQQYTNIRMQWIALQHSLNNNGET